LSHLVWYLARYSLRESAQLFSVVLMIPQK
jgi:hypothetical protein